MRSKLAAVAVGLGVFMIVAAVLVRAYAYPTLATVPADYEGITRLEAKDAQVFNSDPEVLETETTDLEVTSRTIADSGADAPDGTVVWVNSTTVTRADGSVFQQARERASFDAVSGAAVECESCDSWVEVAAGERVPTVREGQVFKFPFDTQKKDYPVWDGTVEQAVDAVYEGEEKIDGLTVYKFVQTIEPQVVETREVPGSVFGSDEASVDAEMWYGMTRTFFVEPTTGSPVDRVEERVQELRYDGETVPAFTATVEYTDEQVAELVDDASSNATLLGGMKLTFPLILALLGIALLAAGLFLGRSAAAHRREEAEEKKLVNA
ncbi:Protein of unknown function (DUF3068) [Nocardioides sp. J9]|uniref:DUF3068 domain-containing protein n=1 Tax=unclassified Nocardioides TaxID=2615069 RepID=UPI0004BC0F69|nr:MULTISPECIES: DUF3068 domain-containing protein [unclassified Nocardioides]TWG96933.1 Protein of unknown function (DUF3068) [Nocardioides sp. J9]